ncbi:integration host factor, actinobacterial type [Citricoccus nitrophenolicus]|uniref:Integration host factor, actinobacterial type n=1 Tax=Citricoccus nitrophenolicus TaxID=863575 RepID=A0ABV0IM75_9MICC|nr:integration host factor, actinobacterial type [Citricoccus sp. I39-566]NUL48653.1 DNA-binding protein [Cellulosimicrobium funkei]WMY77491.1 integration host factor, actinobacterial type [Citricoccus sp. I39-566]
MALKELSAAEREAARSKALQARTARADLKESFRSGRSTLEQVFTAADQDAAIGRMRTVDLLQTLQGVGEVRAAKIMESCGISPNRRLRGLGRRQREALIAYIGR